MPSTHEFTLIVDANTLVFIQLVIKIFLGLVLGLAFLFGFMIAALYVSARLLVFGYSLMCTLSLRAMSKQGVVL